MEKHGIPDETCQTYRATDGHCQPHGICETCSQVEKSQDACVAVQNYRLFKISDFGYTYGGSDIDVKKKKVLASERIMAEIYARGPVACEIYATKKFDKYSGGIFGEFGFWAGANHVVSLVGWGEESGVQCAHTHWGTYWGENGFFRILRSDFLHGLGIERSCTFADPIIPKTFKPDSPLPKDVPFGKYLTKHPRVGDNRPESKSEGHDLPKEYDIRNMNGVNYATTDRNQNSPRSCESSWAQAAIAALDDRLSLLRSNAFPELSLSVQVLINCIGGQNACKKGNSPADAYSYIKKQNIPDESCSPYRGDNRQCTLRNTCLSCWPSECHIIKPGKYTQYTIASYGKMSGDEAVKQEIFHNGPVACEICAPDAFFQYGDGIFSSQSICESEQARRRYVEIAGWGEKDGVPYWIGRNSWGTYWGENGWFKLRMRNGDLGVTRKCYWAIPVAPTLFGAYMGDAEGSNDIDV